MVLHIRIDMISPRLWQSTCRIGYRRGRHSFYPYSAFQRPYRRAFHNVSPRLHSEDWKQVPRGAIIISRRGKYLVLICCMGLSLSAAFLLTRYYAVRETMETFDSIILNPTLPLFSWKLAQARRRSLTETDEKLQKARKLFLRVLGPEGVNDDLGARIAHSSTEWSPAPRGALDRPSLILYPQTTQQVRLIAIICRTYELPMIAFGGGTSLEGTLAAIHGEVCIDFSKMNRILALHERDMDVVVQPGVGYEDLNKWLAEKDLFFPPDPGPGAQIGGMISQGCSGTNAYRYGTMKDWVINLTVVLVDGTVIKTRQRPRKSSAGYDLTRLFVGSEGTLGFVTEACLKVTNKPENVQVAVASFPSTQAAVNAAIKAVQKGIPLAALELLDGPSMRAINNGGYCEKEFSEDPSLFLKFSGSELGVQEQIQEMKMLANENRSTSFVFSKNEEEASALWQARKTMLFSLMTLKKDPDDKFIGTDVAVPISRLGDMIESTNAKLEASGLVGACMGHVGDGNFHSAIFFSEGEKDKAIKLVSEIEKMGIEMEGTVTGEHGIGIEKLDGLVEELGLDTVALMRKIKFALDPLWQLNPDKVVRYGEKERPVASPSENPSTGTPPQTRKSQRQEQDLLDRIRGWWTRWTS